jgi:Subtilase family
MPSNPIQVVLNSQNYVQKVDVQPGGGNKDFYEGRDAAFVAHRGNLAAQIMEIAALESPEHTPFHYVHVQLQDVAWAKSHRPIQALFQAGKVRTVGGNQLGTLIVEMTTADALVIFEKVLTAEETPKLAINKKTSELEEKPSRLRSEVGGVREIRRYVAQDRRKFTIDGAIGWLSDPRTGGSYYVETFISLNAEFNTERDRLRANMLRAFQVGIEALKLPIALTSAQTDWTPGAIFVIKILKNIENLEIHARLLSYLDSHPIVRSIMLPPVLQSATVDSQEGDVAVLSLPDPDVTYPVVGIIDTGVAIVAMLNPWRAGAVDFFTNPDQNYGHGTFTAGLVSGGATLNNGTVFDELPCKYFDLGLHPTSNYESYFPRGFLDFLEQLDVEIEAAKKLGVRVFNMSLSVTLPVDDSNYSLFANALDRISDRHDVLFILPAGNLDESTVRDHWPDSPEDCLKMLAEYRHQGKDKIFQPADSLRSLVVGALDPEHGAGDHRPSRYTRKGPGPSLGAKPDVAHIGGRYDGERGLNSLSCDGLIVSGCGTSYASPLVAKTIAVLNDAIAGKPQLETLSALAIHNAQIPKVLAHKKLINIARDFVGAGTPSIASRTLIGSDNEITLVFNGTLLPGHELGFNFAWPASLVNAHGQCRGAAKLTLVYRPPIDRQYGAEFVLVNIDAWLRQEIVNQDTGEITYKNRLKSDAVHGVEKERVAHGAKWWPVKRFATSFPRGVGRSSQWKLVLDSLCRSQFTIPEAGVPFCAVLTISDPSGSEDIFGEVRQQLQASGVKIEDIRIGLSSQIRARNS